jgi:hypothetical protein
MFLLYITGGSRYKKLACRPVALTVRASDSKSEGWGFESLLACQYFLGFTGFPLEAFFVYAPSTYPNAFSTHTEVKKAGVALAKQAQAFQR